MLFSRRSTGTLDRMKRRSSARQRLASQLLSGPLVLRALRSVWPRRNPVGQPNLTELLQEARDFGVLTFGAYLRLMRRNRRAVIQFDQEPLDAEGVRFFAGEYGRETVRELQRKRYFFNIEGLARTAFELEFGDRFEEYCRKAYPQKDEAQDAI